MTRRNVDPYNRTAAQRHTVTISRSMSACEIVEHLVNHGCRDITDELDPSSSSQYPVANGGFGDVYRVKFRDGSPVAVKTMRLQVDPAEEGAKHLKHASRELHIWAKCDHPNVLSLLGVVVFRDRIGMVSPWMEHGNLPSYLSREPDADRFYICVQISGGLAYLHRCGIVHGDLKGVNILVSMDGIPMLADFGNAILRDQSLLFTATSTNRALSPRWAAPELLRALTHCTMEADVYGLGMTILETITGNVPYNDKSDYAILHSVIYTREPPERPKDTTFLSRKAGDMLWAVLLSCWSYEPQDRPSAIMVASTLKKMYQGQTCPPPSPMFAGQTEPLACIERRMLDGSGERHVFVLDGLGGSGKTQVVLKFVEKHKHRFRCVIYIDASSSDAIEADLKSIALHNNTGESSSDALSWIAQKLEQPWLIIYNDADDPAVDLRRYFPRCSHGRILITTRNHGLASLAQPADLCYRMSGMPLKEARSLLWRAANLPEDTENDTSEVLVKELGYLASAIAQAGTYIRMHQCTIQRCLDMCRSDPGRLLGNDSPEPDDRPFTTYGSWRVGYDRLARRDKWLFGLLAFMQHDYIVEDIFRFAAIRILERTPRLPSTDAELLVERIVTQMLARFRTPDNQWNRKGFLDAIGQLRACSLIDFNPVNMSYSMHPLIQQWARTIIEFPAIRCRCAALLLALSISPESRAEDYVHHRTLLGHLDALPQKERCRPRLAERFQLVYYQFGRYEDSEQLLKMILDLDDKNLGYRRNPDVLSTMARLTDTYWGQGRWNEAEKLGQSTLAARRRVQGEKHPDTLKSMARLANTYRKQGRWQKAELEMCVTLNVRNHVLGETHSDTLATKADLARVYVDKGRWDKAETLLLEVLRAESKSLGDQHPDTLATMSSLARTYRGQCRWEDAKKLGQRVLDSNKRVLGPDHPNTVSSMADLALVYRDTGQLSKARLLMFQALDNSKHIRSHPDTIKRAELLAKIELELQRGQDAPSGKWKWGMGWT